MSEPMPLSAVVRRYRAHNDVLEKRLRTRSLIGLAVESLSTEEANAALQEWRESMLEIRKRLRKACGEVA